MFSRRPFLFDLSNNLSLCDVSMRDPVHNFVIFTRLQLLLNGQVSCYVTDDCKNNLGRNNFFRNQYVINRDYNIIIAPWILN